MDKKQNLNLNSNVNDFIEKQRQLGKQKLYEDVKNRSDEKHTGEHRTRMLSDLDLDESEKFDFDDYFQKLLKKCKYLIILLFGYLLVSGLIGSVTGTITHEDKDFDSLKVIATKNKVDNIADNFKIANNYDNQGDFHYVGVYILYPSSVIVSNESRQFSEEKLYDYFKEKMEKVNKNKGHVRFNFKELGLRGVDVDLLINHSNLENTNEDKVRMIVVDSTKYHLEDGNVKYDIVKDIRINNEKDLVDAISYVDGLE